MFIQVGLKFSYNLLECSRVNKPLGQEYIGYHSNEKFKYDSRAGEGAHGFVFKAMDKRSGKLVALKKITFNPDLGVPKKTIREICSLRVLKSKNVVKLLEVACMGSSAVLVMEYLPWSLADLFIRKDILISLAQIKTYLRMILSGIAYMHENHIMHRDVKPANLLISEVGILKIADFGLARIFNSEKNRQYSHQVATRWYRAPELLYGSRNYTPSVDMWSVGCILAEMINRQPLFPGETDIEQLAIVLGTLGTPNEETWPGLTDLPDYNKIDFSPSVPKSWTVILPTADAITLNLVSKIIIYDGVKRITAKQALKHRFFRERPLPCKLSSMPNLEGLKLEQDPIWNFQDFEECFSEINF